MKKFGLILIILSCIYLLAAQTILSNIVINGENPIVTRIVLPLSQKTSWSYKTDIDHHQVNIYINNCLTSNPIIEGISSSSLIGGISSTQDGRNAHININVTGPFYIETLNLDNPYKIVIDLFQYKKVYSNM